MHLHSIHIPTQLLLQNGIRSEGLPRRQRDSIRASLLHLRCARRRADDFRALGDDVEGAGVLEVEGFVEVDGGDGGEGGGFVAVAAREGDGGSTPTRLGAGCGWGEGGGGGGESWGGVAQAALEGFGEAVGFFEVFVFF